MTLIKKTSVYNDPAIRAKQLPSGAKFPLYSVSKANAVEDTVTVNFGAATKKEETSNTKKTKPKKGFFKKFALPLILGLVLGAGAGIGAGFLTAGMLTIPALLIGAGTGLVIGALIIALRKKDKATGTEEPKTDSEKLQVLQNSFSDKEKELNELKNKIAKGDEGEIHQENQELTMKVAQLEAELSFTKSKIEELELKLKLAPGKTLKELSDKEKAELQTFMKTINTLKYDWSYQHPVKRILTKSQTRSVAPPPNITASTKKYNVRQVVELYKPPTLATIKSKAKHQWTIGEKYANEVEGIHSQKASISAKEQYLGKRHKTSYSMKAAKSTIKWPNSAVARDLIQNFYDGHKHKNKDLPYYTLDGVKFDITSLKGPLGKKKYKIRIAGKGTYYHEEIFGIGVGRDKANDPYSAGGYNEGSGKVTACLLGRGITDSVRYASGNWVMDFTPPNTAEKLFSQNEMIYSKLDKVSPIEGNYLEFTTTDEEFIQHLLNATEFFYSKGNKDYQNPDFENNDFGVKVLDYNQKGTLRFVQQFEVGERGKWKDVPGIQFYSFRKPNKELNERTEVIASDRVPLNPKNIQAFFSQDFIPTMKTDEMEDLLVKMKPYWSPYIVAEKQQLGGADKATDTFTHKFMSGLIHNLRIKGKEFTFPKEYVAITASDKYPPDDVKDFLNRRGFTICAPEFSDIGMPTVEETMNQLTNFKPLKPDPKLGEIRKINILKQQTQLFLRLFYKNSKIIINNGDYDNNNYIKQKVENWSNQHFPFDKDVNETPIYIFDNKDIPGKSNLLVTTTTDYDDDVAAIWIDKTFLSLNSFSDLQAEYIKSLLNAYGQMRDDSSYYTFHTSILKWVVQSTLDGSRQINEKDPFLQKNKILDNAWYETIREIKTNTAKPKE